MTTDQKIALITRNLEETLTEGELRELIESETPLVHYIGFEISGKVHLGQGLAVMNKVKDLHDAGAKTIIWLADWHGWINGKLDGTLETASRMARDYFEEAMKAAYICVGGNPEDLTFMQGSEVYSTHPEFWAKTINVAKATTISRMMRSTDIMGRMSGDSSNAATLFYPAMQAADIFQLGVNIAHAGTDQRNVHIVARDAAKDVGEQKPIAIHHHLIMGLKPLGENDDLNLSDDASYEEKSAVITALKMSKSKPDTAVFITDHPEEIKRKVNNAYAPEGIIKYNPILDWTKYLIFYDENSSLSIKRDEKFGGDVTYSSYEELEKDYIEKNLHPMDLKAAVAEWLIEKLAPAREYFEDPKRKAALEEITTLTSKG